MKKLLIIITLCIMPFFMTACSEEAKVEKATKEKLVQVEKEVTEGLDKELTFEILKNEKVVEAYVQDKDGTAKAVLLLQKGTSEEEKVQLMEKYQKELAEKYPEKNVNVIVTVQE